MIRNNSRAKEDLFKEKYLSNIIEETNSVNNTINQMYSNNKKRYKNAFRRNIKPNNIIKKKLMTNLLKVMDKNTHISLNNINSINFIYQAYDKGLHMINNNKDIKSNSLNNTEKIMDCMENHKFYRNIETNKFYKSNKISLNPSENNKFNTFYCTDKILRLNTKKNFLNKKPPFKKSYSYCNKEEKNNNKNFALLPLKNILTKKNVHIFEHVPMRKHRERTTSIIYKKKKVLEEEKEKGFRENLKIFSDKYEKEKEDFNNILFDECIELRKKRFKLESFIKKFTNKHFVEKLYKIKEIANQKCQ